MAGEIRISASGGTQANSARGASSGSTTRLGVTQYSQSRVHYRLYLDLAVTVPVNGFTVSLKPTDAYSSYNSVHWELTDDPSLTAPPADDAACVLCTGTLTMSGRNRVEFTVTLPAGKYLLPGATCRLWLLRTESTANSGYWDGILGNSPAVSPTALGGLVHVRQGEAIVPALPYAKVNGALCALLPYVKKDGPLKIGV